MTRRTYSDAELAAIGQATLAAMASVCAGMMVRGQAHELVTLPTGMPEIPGETGARFARKASAVDVVLYVVDTYG